MLRNVRDRGIENDSKVLHMNQTAKPFNIEVSGDMPTCSDNCSTIDFTMPVASSAKLGVLRPSHTANMSPIDNSSERKRQRDRERFLTMSIEKRSEINKKHRETRQQKKEPNRTTGVPREVDIEENMDLDDNSDWLHRSEMYQANHNETSGDILTPGGAPETGGHPPNENR
ncbi:hypothetical protein BS78_08G128200 [Paspalum vaginatum]|nr:hypothetical protein BS78_08G128200 [Paspalum vaginatum]